MFKSKNLERGREISSLRQSALGQLLDHCSVLSVGKIVESADYKATQTVMTHKISMF